jgi:hypothetical protein
MNFKTTEEMKKMSLEEIKEYEAWVGKHANRAWHIRRFKEMGDD